MCNNTQVAKNAAKEAKQILAGLGHSVSLGHALELVSRLQQAETWNHLSALLKKPDIDAVVPEWDISKGAMSDEEYVANQGTRCPVCGSDQLEGGEVNIDGGHAWQEMGCNHCNSSWNDCYSLNGYGELEEGQIPDEDEDEDEDDSNDHPLKGLDQKGALRLARNDWCEDYSLIDALLYLKQNNREAYSLIMVSRTLGKVGVDVMEDSNQPGLWLWRDGAEGADISFDTEAEAIWDGWSHIAGLVMGDQNMSSEEWDRLSIDQQIAQAIDLLEDVG